MAGTIVVLNGPSSAGKSTLANAVRDQMGQRCTIVPIDRLFAFAHPEHPINWTLYFALTEATFAAATAMARADYDVLVDIVFERRDCLVSAVRALEGFRHHYVAVTCELEELEHREVARGNRPLGLARRQYGTVLHDARYGLQIDTTRAETADCAAQVVRLFAHTSP